jgi:hypothetical protein
MRHNQFALYDLFFNVEKVIYHQALPASKKTP